MQPDHDLTVNVAVTQDRDSTAGAGLSGTGKPGCTLKDEQKLHEQGEKEKTFQTWQGEDRMSQDMEAKIHIRGCSKIKERTSGEHGGGVDLNLLCKGRGQ